MTITLGFSPAHTMDSGAAAGVKVDDFEINTETGAGAMQVTVPIHNQERSGRFADLEVGATGTIDTSDLEASTAHQAPRSCWKRFTSLIYENCCSPSARFSWIKTISWRISATGITFTIAFIFLESVNKSLAVAAADFVAKFIFYFIHERIWEACKIKDKRSSSKEGSTR